MCDSGINKGGYLEQGKSVASPTVSIESLSNKLVIDSYEGIYVATFYVTGAYLQAEMHNNNTSLVNLRG